MAVTGSDDHTATNCLTQNDWRLDMATDNFYQDPLKYFVEPPRASVDRKKIDILFNKYRSEQTITNYTEIFFFVLQIVHVRSM
jgi:DCN1-like protein 1/2